MTKMKGPPPETSHEAWARFALCRKQNRSLVSSIGQVMGLTGPALGKHIKGTDYIYPTSPAGEALSLIRSAAKDLHIRRLSWAARQERSIHDRRTGEHTLRAALTDWRAALGYGFLHVLGIAHSLNIKLTHGAGTLSLWYPIGLVNKRTKSKVPWVVTDRFVLSHDSDNPYPAGHIPNGATVRCRYISAGKGPGEYTLVDGYLHNHQGFYGCAARDFDAKKAATMKAVQHVKGKIGV